MYVLGSPFPQPLSRSSLVYFLDSDPLVHSPYISSPSHYLIFTTLAHTIATCFAVVPRLSYIPNLSQLITWKSVFLLNVAHPSDHSHLCSLKCHLHFLFL